MYNKLHIGAGDNYLNGWVNVDATPDLGPDICARVTGLPFPNRVFHRVCMVHVVEHIPYKLLAPALSEIYRVMKPGGILIIETPEIEGVFRDFLAADTDRRKELLSYTFGLDVPGMKHEILLPAKLLAWELNTAGFKILSMGPGLSHLGNSGLRVEAACTPGPRADAWSGFWRTVVTTGMSDAINQLEMLEVRNIVEQCMGRPGADCFVGLSALNPVLTHWIKHIMIKWVPGEWATKPEEWADWAMNEYARTLATATDTWDYDKFMEIRLKPLFQQEQIFAGGLKLFSRFRVEQYLRALLVRGNRLLYQGHHQEALEIYQQVDRGGLWFYGALNQACALAIMNRHDRAKAIYHWVLNNLSEPSDLVIKEIQRRLKKAEHGEAVLRPFNYGDLFWRRGYECIPRTD